MSLVVLKKRQTPLFLRFIFPTPVTSLWPVDFPFKIFISGNLTGFQFIHPNHPFFQKIIQNSIVKPHTDRSMGRPAIIVMVVNGSVGYFIAFFTGKSPREKQMQCRWIKFIQPEKQFHHFGSVTSSGIIEGIRINIKSLCHFIDQIFLGEHERLFHIVQFYVDRSVRSSLTVLFVLFSGMSGFF